MKNGRAKRKRGRGASKRGRRGRVGRRKGRGREVRKKRIDETWEEDGREKGQGDMQNIRIGDERVREGNLKA